MTVECQVVSSEAGLSYPCTRRWVQCDHASFTGIRGRLDCRFELYGQCTSTSCVLAAQEIAKHNLKQAPLDSASRVIRLFSGGAGMGNCEKCKKWDGRVRVTLRILTTGEVVTMIGCSDKAAARDRFLDDSAPCGHFERGTK